MSNHTFLISTREAMKPLRGRCPEQGRLLMAATSIPVFWYALFDEDCIALGPSADPDSPPYLHLTSPTDEALARAEDRWPAIAAVVGRQMRQLFLTWLAYVRDRASSFLHVETDEWAGMFETSAEFDTELRACLQAFDQPPGAAWRKILAQAHVGRHHRGGPDPLGNLSYCGFSYGEPVPWSEETRAVTGLMSDAVYAEVRRADGPEGLTTYLEEVYSPIFETKPAVCVCGGRAFRLRFERGNGVRRTCADCGRGHFVMNSRDYWDDAKAADWACKGCGGGVANVTVGAQADATEKHLEYVSVGVRCVACGRLGVCTGWEVWEGPDAINDECSGAWWLCGDGEQFLESDKVAEALDAYVRAWGEIPPPRHGRSVTRAVIAGVVGCCRGLSDWSGAEGLRTELAGAGEVIYEGLTPGDADALRRWVAG